MNQYSRKELRKIPIDASVAMASFPGVHAVGIGGRHQGGRSTGELALLVLVKRKRPRSELAPAEVVPASFAGLPTDVIEVPPLENLVVPVPGVPFIPKDDIEKVRDKKGYRPLTGGCGITMPQRGSGTLGFFARLDDPNRPGVVFAVTCFHVLFEDVTTEIPAVRLGQPLDKKGFSDCVDPFFGTYEAGIYDLDVDAAVIRLDPGSKWVAELIDIGVVRGTHDLMDGEIRNHTYQVRKRGETTRLTGGIVWGINITGVADHRGFFNGILIKPNPAVPPAARTAFAEAGDSGSAVVNDANEIVGILFKGAATPEGEPPPLLDSWGLAYPIADFLSSLLLKRGLDLSVATASVLGDVQVVPGARRGLSAPIPVDSELGRRLERDLGATEAGNVLLGLWAKHAEEIALLLRTERRLFTVWRRNSGPSLFRSMLGCLEPGTTIPVSLANRSTDECWREILDALATAASPTLRHDIATCRSLIGSIGGLSYTEFLGRLESTTRKAERPAIAPRSADPVLVDLSGNGARHARN